MPRAADPRAKITLLRAAEEVFAESGVEGAKVEDIAKRAGLSKGAFYLHFDSKESALEHVVESFLARCGMAIAPPSEYPDFPDDPDELLGFHLARAIQIFEFLWENRAVLRILATCQGEHAYLIDAWRADIDQREREWLERLRRLELLRREIDVDVCVALVSGGYNELTTKMLRQKEQPPLESWLRTAQETYFRAWGTPELVDAIERRNRRVTDAHRRRGKS